MLIDTILGLVMYLYGGDSMQDGSSIDHVKRLDVDM